MLCKDFNYFALINIKLEEILFYTTFFFRVFSGFFPEAKN